MCGYLFRRIMSSSGYSGNMKFKITIPNLHHTNMTCRPPYLISPADDQCSTVNGNISSSFLSVWPRSLAVILYIYNEVKSIYFNQPYASYSVLPCYL
jgi:hypothetical protein